ncbi:MAG TPA: hypothetical protein VFM47_08865 [Gaiellales bacterium]|nr:hypothetical protein [Gaiellales bacterium]
MPHRNLCIWIYTGCASAVVDQSPAATYVAPITFSTASASKGSTIMASIARIARIMIVASGILALSVTAAQARPIGVGHTGQSAANVGDIYQGFYGGQALYQHDAAAKISSVMSPAIDPATAQLGYHRVYGPQALYKHDAATAKVSSVMSPAVDRPSPPTSYRVPVVVTQAQPLAASDSGFNWTAGMLGAGIATLVLLLAAITASRIRPQRVAHP